MRAVSCGGGERAVPAAAPGANDGKNTSFTKRKRDEKTEAEVGILDLWILGAFSKSEEAFPVFEFGGKVYKIALLIPRYWKMAGTNLNF